MKFLVCALFYGDYPALAARCAETLSRLRSTGRVDMLLGLNEVSAASTALIEAALPQVEAVRATPQLYKYPMVRELLRRYRGDATHLMWFDDDSCLRPGVDAGAWLSRVAAVASGTEASVGAVYGLPLSPSQRAWVRQQSWYAGRELPQVTLFTTGGWLVAPLALLRRFDWPPPSLRHNGGDVAFGALLHQHGLKPVQFQEGVAINADGALRQSRAARRGHSEDPVGHEGNVHG